MKIVITHDPELVSSQSNNSKIINSFHSLVTSSIAEVQSRLGNQAAIVEANSDLEILLEKEKPDLVFNTSIRKLLGSESAYAPGILEKLRIPFTGPSARACTTIYNKFKAVKILESAGIPTPRAFITSREQTSKIPESVKFPIFIKPLKGGCSRGITRASLVKTQFGYTEQIQSSLNETSDNLIIEEFLPGREFSVAILGNEIPKALPVIEFLFKEDEVPFRTYKKKMINYEIENTVCPAELSEQERTSIENLAINAYKALKCRDYARVDIRMNANNEPAVLEVNALPNLEPEKSSFAVMANAAGITFDVLIEEIMEFALLRNEMAIP